MKKVLAVIIALVLVIGLAACGDGGSQVINNNGGANTNASADTNTAPNQNAQPNGGSNGSSNETANGGAGTAADGEDLVFGGQSVYPGKAFDASKISEKANVMEIPSCALSGTDTVYTYKDAEITVSEYKGSKVIYSVYFTSPQMKTAKGIALGSTKADMEKAYGTDYKNAGSQYEYTLGDAVLAFIVENDKVTSITYTLIIQ